MPSVNDNQLTFYSQNAPEPNDALPEAEKSYWGPRQSVFTPHEKFSRADVKRQGLIQVTGVQSGSITDLEVAWLKQVYGLGPNDDMSLADLWERAIELGYEQEELEELRNEAVLWFDLREEPQTATKQSLTNKGWLGAPGNAQFGSTVGADTNDPIWLPHTGQNYVYIPSGTAMGTIQKVNSNVHLATGDLDIRVNLNRANPGSHGYCDFGRANFGIFLSAYGTISLFATSNVSVTDDPTKYPWYRVTRSASTGVATFYYSLNGANWVQIGVPQAMAPGVFPGQTTPGQTVTIGAESEGAYYYRWEFRNGINGPIVEFWDASNFNGWTITRPTSGYKGLLVNRPTLLFSTDDYLTIPDNNAIDFGASQPFTVYAYQRYQPATAFNNPMGKGTWNGSPGYWITADGSDGYYAALNGQFGGYVTKATGSLCSFGLSREANGDLVTIVDGVKSVGGVYQGDTSSATPLYFGVANGSPYYASMEWYGGAVFRRALTADELQLIDDHFNRDLTQQERLRSEAVLFLDPKTYSGIGKVINQGTLGPAGDAQLGVAAGADTNDPLFLPWTGTDYTHGPSGVIVTRPTFWFTTDDYLRVEDNPALDFLQNQSFTVVTAFRAKSPFVSYGALISKRLFTSGGYDMLAGANVNRFLIQNTTATLNPESDGTPPVSGKLSVWAGTRNTATNKITLIQDGVKATTGSDVSDTLANASPVMIGSDGTFASTIEWYGSAIWNRVLTDQEIQLISNTFLDKPDPPPEVYIEKLKSEALVFLDPRQYSGTGPVLNQGILPLSAQLGSVAGAADTNDPLFLPWTGENYTYIPAGTTASPSNLSKSPSAANAVTGDIDICVHIQRPPTYNPAAPQTQMAAINGNLSSQGGWTFLIQEDFGPCIRLAFSVGGTFIDHQPADPGRFPWYRVTRVASTGEAKFYYSTDGDTWVNWATLNSTPGPFTPSLVPGFSIGAPSAGIKFYRVEVRNGINGPLVEWWDANNANGFTQVRPSSGPTPVQVTRPTFLFATDDQLFCGLNSQLDFGTTGQFTLVSAQRSWNSYNYPQLLTKNAAPNGYQLALFGNGYSGYFTIAGSYVMGWAVTPGKLSVVAGRRNATLVDMVVDGAVSTGTGTWSGNATSVGNLHIGRAESGNFADMEWFGAAIFNRALSNEEIELVTDYFQTNDVPALPSKLPGPLPVTPPPTGLQPPQTATVYQNVWKGPNPTTVTNANDFEVGMIFKAKVPIWSYGVRIWNPGSVTYPGTRKARMWNKTRGTFEEEITLPARLNPGWNEFHWDFPVPLTVHAEYIISYSTGMPNDYGTSSVGFPSNADMNTAGTYSDTPGQMPNTIDSIFYGVDLLYIPVTTGFQLHQLHAGWNIDLGALTDYVGPAVVDVAGTQLINKRFPDGIVINAPNVVMKNCLVNPNGGNIGVLVREFANNFLIEDTTITSLNPPLVVLDRGLSFEGDGRGQPIGCTARRVLIYRTQRGVRFGNGNTIEYCWVGDNMNATAAHTTAMSTNGGANNIIVTMSFMDMYPGTNASSAISCYPEVDFGGASHNLTFTQNYMAADATFLMYLGFTPPETPNQNVKVNSNWFSTKYYVTGGIEGIFGPRWNVDQPGDSCSDNKWYDERPTGGGYTNKHGQPVTKDD